MGGVDALRGGGPPFGGRALARLREWPALRALRAEGGGAALAAGSRQIVHLHRADEAELYLTWPVIERMSAALAGSVHMWCVPGEDWARVLLHSDTDVSVLESLVSVAIQAHSRAGRRPGPRTSLCPHLLRAHVVPVPA